MPRATVVHGSPEDQQQYDLKTLEGGYVTLRRLTYGEFLQRRQMTTSMRLQAGQSDEGFSGEMDLVNYKAVEFEFKHCIIDHNLEDEEGKQLDFKRPGTLDRLNPKVGEEIGSYIDKMNQYNEAEHQGN